MLQPGEHAPWFKAPVLSGSPSYGFDTVAGRHIMPLFFGSARIEAVAAALRSVSRMRRAFDDERACFFGVTIDPQDAAEGRIEQDLPGIRYVLDYERLVSTAYGAAKGDHYSPHWLLLSPSLQVLGRYALDQGQEALADLVAKISETDGEAWAPVLSVPHMRLLPAIARAYQFQVTRMERYLVAFYEASAGHFRPHWDNRQRVLRTAGLRSRST